MNREFHNWWSPTLGRHMEMQVFGHGGLPAVVFPTSQGRFFEFEERGMVNAVADKIDRGELQLFCVDSVDAESWYNRGVGVDWRIARHIQYENYILREVVPLIRHRNWSPHLAAVGCSFGGYHAANIYLKHPWVFTGCLSMSGAFDMRDLGFLGGYSNSDTYFNLPFEYLPNMHNHDHLEQLRRNRMVLATGVHDQCWNDNERLASAMRAKALPVKLDVWGNNARHDWPWWHQMAHVYL